MSTDPEDYRFDLVHDAVAEDIEEQAEYVYDCGFLSLPVDVQDEVNRYAAGAVKTRRTGDPYGRSADA